MLWESGPERRIVGAALSVVFRRGPVLVSLRLFSGVKFLAFGKEDLIISGD